MRSLRQIAEEWQVPVEDMLYRVMGQALRAGHSSGMRWQTEASPDGALRVALAWRVALERLGGQR